MSFWVKFNPCFSLVNILTSFLHKMINYGINWHFLSLWILPLFCETPSPVSERSIQVWRYIITPIFKTSHLKKFWETTTLFIPIKRWQHNKLWGKRNNTIADVKSLFHLRHYFISVFISTFSVSTCINSPQRTLSTSKRRPFQNWKFPTKRDLHPTLAMHFLQPGWLEGGHWKPSH